jgi:hypothetical protein
MRAPRQVGDLPRGPGLEDWLLRRGREFAAYDAAIEAAKSWPAVLAARS